MLAIIDGITSYRGFMIDGLHIKVIISNEIEKYLGILYRLNYYKELPTHSVLYWKI